MKSIIKISKRGIIAILTLCILLGIAGTGLNVTAMAAETTATVEETAVATEEATVVIEETTPELIPMMAQRCCDDDYSDYDGMTFNNTSQGLNARGIPFSGSGSGIVLLNPKLDMEFSQCGTGLCVFITLKATNKQLCWFKVGSK